MNKTALSERQPSARVARKRRQAREDILDVAHEILHTGGIEAVTLASVAGALGMTKQALYHYFPSKEALTRSLVTTLVDDEIAALIAAINESDSAGRTLETLIRAFYDHYIHRLEAFRAVYCQSQLYTAPELGIDSEMIRDEINPRTRHLFDILEQRIAQSNMGKSARERIRQLAFIAWTSALGLLTMLSVADATNDPLIHSDKDLLDTLSAVFNAAAKLT